METKEAVATAISIVSGLSVRMTPFRRTALPGTTDVILGGLCLYLFYLLGPGRYCFRQLLQHLGVVPSRPLQHMKRVICCFNNMQRRLRPEPRADGTQQVEIGKSVTGSLQK